MQIGTFRDEFRCSRTLPSAESLSDFIGRSARLLFHSGVLSARWNGGHPLWLTLIRNSDPLGLRILELWGVGQTLHVTFEVILNSNQRTHLPDDRRAFTRWYILWKLHFLPVPFPTWWKDPELPSLPRDTLDVLTIKQTGPIGEEKVPGMTVLLQDWQRQSVDWALYREEHPLAEEIWVPCGEAPNQFWFNQYSCQFTLEPPDLTTRGGILADAVGLGKTIEGLAVTLKGGGSTLVVCPTSTLAQWVRETRKRAPTLKVCVFHGAARRLDPEADITLTTYGIVLNEDRKSKRLHAREWTRLLIDEGHACRHFKAQSMALTALPARARFILSATPLTTEYKELNGQLKVLHLRSLVKGLFPVIEDLAFARIARALLTFILTRCVIRHRTDQIFNGRPALLAMEKTIKVVKVPLLPTVRQSYMNVARAAATQRNPFLLINQLRHLCSGQDPGHHSQSNFDYPLSHKPSFNALDDPCCICLEPFDSPLQTQCQHLFCRECILRVQICPQCRAPIHPLKRIVLVEPKGSGGPGGPGEPGGAGPAQSIIPKDQALLQEIEKAPKTVVMTLFGDTCQRIKHRLEQKGIPFAILTGSMSIRQRARALTVFEEDPTLKVFLMTVRTGSVGLTLTAATQLILMEPGLNPAVDVQATGRICRMGQNARVTIVYLLAEDTLEEVLQANNVRSAPRASKELIANYLRRFRSQH